MLKLNHLFENIELAKHALTHWPHDTESLDEMLEYFRISSNAIYPFKWEQQVYFLRLAPCEEKLKSNLAGELEWIQFLNDHDFPALKPIKTHQDDLFLELDTPWGPYYASVFKRVPGQSLEDVDFSVDIIKQFVDFA